MTDPCDTDITYFLETIRTASSYDFSNYSFSSLKRRILKIQSDHQLELNELCSKMQVDPDFLEIVAKRITVNTTELFRDPKMWIDLKRFFLPGLSEKQEINIWHSGCSTGQEVYSMMILLDVMGLLDKSHILATDINSDVLETAGKGTYKYRFNIEYLENYNKVINDGKEKVDFIPFRKYCNVDPVKDTFQMKSFLFQKPKFNKFDLVNDNNKKEEFDLIICRNVIIYFNNELQERAIRLFHEALKPSGILMLGRHESIVGPVSLLFEKKQHFYLKKHFP